MITDHIADVIICLLELLMKLGHLILALTIASNIFNVFPARLRKVTPFHGLSECRISRFTSSCIIDVRRRSGERRSRGWKCSKEAFSGRNGSDRISVRTCGMCSSSKSLARYNRDRGERERKGGRGKGGNAAPCRLPGPGMKFVFVRKSSRRHTSAEEDRE